MNVVLMEFVDAFETAHQEIAPDIELRLQIGMSPRRLRELPADYGILLCPFHYFGITDLEINGQVFDDSAGLRNFANLVCDARVNYILEKAEYFGYSGDRVKGLIFCSRKEEARELSRKINLKTKKDGSFYRTEVLTGEDNQARREEVIERLTDDEADERLDYILTVDIFNEGIVISLGVSILIFGERPGILQILGVLLCLIALVLITGGGESEKEMDPEQRLAADSAKSDGSQNAISRKGDPSPSSESSRPHAGALLAAMFAGGGSSSMPKVFEQVGNRAEDELFFFYLFAAAAVLTVLLILLEKKKSGRSLRLPELAAGIAVGVPNYFASYLLLPALVVLPVFLVYPLNSTGAILLVMAVDALFFHQKHTRRQMVGILLVLAAMVLLNL